MGATNQYITMISSLSVFLQFCLLGSVNYSYAVLFGAAGLCAAALGITQINKHVKKSGRQSVILVFLLTALTFAFVSIPIKMAANFIERQAQFGDKGLWEIAKEIASMGPPSSPSPSH